VGKIIGATRKVRLRKKIIKKIKKPCFFGRVFIIFCLKFFAIFVIIMYGKFYGGIILLFGIKFPTKRQK